MALVLADRVRETTSVVGTNDAALLGAVTSFQSFAVIGNGNTCYYTIADNAGNWETGIGTYSTTGPTLARTTILSSSNGGNKVSFPAGTKDVFVTYPSEKAVYENAAGNVDGFAITGGSINNTPIGGSTPNSGAFTSITASANSSFTSTGALTISKGDTSQRPTPVSGMLRFNTQTSEFEGYNGTAWASVGGAALSNDTSTATNVYPLFASATSGTASTLFTSNAKYLYKPSTGDLQSSQVIAGNGFFVNPNTLLNSYVLPTGYNASSTGPFTIPSGMSVTVSSGARWVVL